jgi:hemerythrin-like domain-containing protein
MAATVKAAVKKPATAKKKTTVKKKTTARKAGAAVKKKTPVAKKKSSTVNYSARDRNLPATVPKKASEQPLMKALRAEHRHMATVMQLFSEQLTAIAGGELVDTHVVYEIMDYMVTWPDRFHHPREDLIYSRVAEVDARTADEVDSLQRDHDQTGKQGRTLLRDIERWRLGEVSGTVVVKSGRTYIDHIYEHMNLEEKLVFPHIEATLSLQDWRELAEDDELVAVGDSVFGPQVQREFRNMTRKLRRSLRRSVERGALVEWIGVEALMESLEVVSIAYESARDTTGEHVRSALKESLEYFREEPLSAPLRCFTNNARVTFRLLGEVAEISRETLQDLSRVNQERKDRVRLMDRGSARR